MKTKQSIIPKPVNNSNQADIQPTAFDNIYTIKVPLKGSPLKYTNSYVIKGLNNSLIIDTGYGSEPCTETILYALNELDIPLENTDIALSHFHNDHSGASTSLIKENRSIYVPNLDYVHFGIGTDTNAYIESRRTQYTKEGINDSEFDTIMKTGSSYKIGPDLYNTQYVRIEEGHTFNVGNYTLNAIHTPGHTPGHLCYFEPNLGILFSGDHILFDISSYITPWPNVEDSLGLYLDSLNKIYELDIKTTFPGHRTSGNYKERIQQLKHHHEERLLECEKVVKNNPGLTAMEITEKLTWKIRSTEKDSGIPLRLLRYAFGECLAHLDHLRATSRIKRIYTNDVYKYYGEI